MPGFFASQGLFIQGITNIWGREVLAAVERGATIVDVREEFETVMKTFDVPNVIYMPTSSFKEAFEQLPRDRPLILADAVGTRSKDAVTFLMEKGFQEVANLTGGIVDWEREGMPTRIDPEELWVGGCACRLRPRKDFLPQK